MRYSSDLKRLKYRRTKIVATLGPSSSAEETISGLLRAGVNVFRLNMSHGEHSGHAELYERIRTLAESAGSPVAILADLCGPKIRVGRFREGGINLLEGDTVTITTRDVEGEPGLIPSLYPGLADDVLPDQRVFLADGAMTLKVLGVDGSEVSCEVLVGGTLTDNKGINLPDSNVSAPCLSEKDRDDARFALGLGVDFLALSFVRRAEDVQRLRELMDGEPNSARIVAKIERPEALRHLEAILEEADAIMVARGDLGVELEPEMVPVVQRDLIEKARRAHKPSIVATQMLESMISNTRPTRAEVADVAHAVASGADAVMLSAETAVGRYPIDAVEMMDSVARHQEAYLWAATQFGSLRLDPIQEPPLEFGAALSNATAQLSRDLMVRAIFVITREGLSAAEMVSSRPAAPIVVLTPSASAQRSVALAWGAIPIQVGPEILREPELAARQQAQVLGLAEKGQTILLVRGFHAVSERNRPSVTLLTV